MPPVVETTAATTIHNGCRRLCRHRGPIERKARSRLAPHVARIALALAAILPLTMASTVCAEPGASQASLLPSEIGGPQEWTSPQGLASTLRVMLLLTVVSLEPAILLMTTSFVRIVVVFGLLRQALGTQEMPSNQILVGLALFLTMFIMAPVGSRISAEALEPALAGKVTVREALERGTPPLRTFMLKQTREADLEQLEQISGRYATRERFLTELTLDPPEAGGDLAGDPLLDEDYLILSTVHSAKGQEWDAVYLLNVADGNFPSEFATGKADLIEEERRLLYVAMTRARQSLQLIAPLKYHVTQQRRDGDKHVYGARSRFMTERLLRTMQARFHGPAEPESNRLVPASSRRIDVAGRMREMW